MKKLYTIKAGIALAILFFSTSSFSQSISPQVIASLGDYVSAGGYSLSYTLGEPATSTLFGSTSILTQGFQQPNDVFTGLQTFAAPALNVQLYPNPASSEINLVLTSDNAGDYTIELVDLLGRVLQAPLTTKLANGQSHFVFNLQQLPSSVYFITLHSNSNDVVHSFKFEKIN